MNSILLFTLFLTWVFFLCRISNSVQDEINKKKTLMKLSTYTLKIIIHIILLCFSICLSHFIVDPFIPISVSKTIIILNQIWKKVDESTDGLIRIWKEIQCIYNTVPIFSLDLNLNSPKQYVNCDLVLWFQLSSQ